MTTYRTFYVQFQSGSTALAPRSRRVGLGSTRDSNSNRVGGGAWILWYEEATSADRTIIVAGPTSDFTRVAGIPRSMLTGVTDDRGTSRFFSATRVGLPADFFTVRNTTVFTGLPLYIPPGEFFNGLRITANAILRPALVWQEIPAGVLPAAG